MKKYYLSCTVYFSHPDDGLSLLYSSEIYTKDAKQIEQIYNSFDWPEVYDEEHMPSLQRIKFSVSVYVTDENDDLVFIKEKYLLLNLQDYVPEFWSVFNSLFIKNN